MEISINAEDINKYIQEAFLKSALGADIKTHLDKGIKELISGYDSPIKGFIKNQIMILVTEYMQTEEVKKALLISIAKLVTPTTVESIVSSGLGELQKIVQNNRWES